MNKPLKKGDMLIPSFYMEANGKKVTGLVLDATIDKARVFLNNGKDCWYDQKTITDLFDVVEKTCTSEAT